MKEWRSLLAPSRPLLWLLLLLVGSTLLRALCYNADAPLWDAGAFVSMGKYFWSGGEVGLCEPMRPPLWPLLLGALWRVGWNPLLAGDWVQIGLSALSIGLVYRLGQALGRGCGLLAAALFTLSPIYFYWGNELYSALPGTCLLLAACLAAQRGRGLLAGCLLALAALTRFELALAVLGCGWLLAVPCAGARRRLSRFAAGLAAVGSTWLLANALAFGDALAPLAQGRLVFTAYAALWQQAPAFYLRFLLQHENWLLVLSPLGLLATALRRDARGSALPAVGFCLLVFFTLQGVQTVRYLLPALPFLYLAASLSIAWIWAKVSPGLWSKGLVALALALTQWPQFGHFRQQDFTAREPDVFQRAAIDFERQGGQSVWISNPTMLVYTDLRAQELLYYPIFDAARARELRSKLPEAQLLLLASADIPCAPPDDGECAQERESFLASLEQLRRLWEARDERGRLAAGIYLAAH